MKDYIFNYLDKRYPIIDNIVYFKDDEPEERVSDLFGVDGYLILREWMKNRVGETYAFQYPNGVRIWFRNGIVHRDKSPAKIFPNGTHEWWVHGCYKCYG